MGDLIKKLAFLGQVKKQDGQILLVIILATVVALTVGLSAISRTITNTRLSTEEANSQKALSAAEAGIEQLLSDPLTALIEKDLSNNASFKANAVAVEGTAFHINDGNLISKDEGADIWLTSSPDFNTPGWGGRLTIYWTGDSSDDCSNAALEVVVIEGDRADPNMKRYAADQCGRGGFGPPDGLNQNFLGKNFKYSVIVDVQKIGVSDGGYIARVIPLYEDAEMAVSATSSLPAQGHVIESVGTSGDTIRKLRVYQANPRLPIEFFPYNVFLP